jgi:methionyl-tRNA formyltransferase
VSHQVADVKDIGADLGVVVAFGRIIKPDVLEALSMVNVHFSLLPRWRGAAPVERAILAGDASTGVCLMAVEEGLDTGGVFRRIEVSIGPDETAAALTARLAELGAGLLVSSLTVGLGEPVPQVGEATYAVKVEVSELRLDWSRPAAALHRVVRVGRAWTTWRGKRLLVLKAEVVTGIGGQPGALSGDTVATPEGALRLLTVAPEGRRTVPGADWARGARLQIGEVLGS